jgi:hypothetical protein
MDSARFDQLAAAVSGRRSRRTALASLVAGLFAGLTPPAAQGQSCPRGRARCGTKCCKSVETCKRGRCVHHCRDGKKNKGETDTDCGGSCRSRKRCPELASCQVDADCETGVCESPSAFPDKKFCLQCRTDTDCVEKDAARPICERSFCYECRTNGDCPSPGRPAEDQFCVEPVSGACPDDVACVCGECRTNADCDEGLICDEDNQCTGATCTEDDDVCLTEVVSGCNGGPFCQCRTTLEDTIFCASGLFAINGCVSAADCVGLRPGTRCIHRCDFEGGGTICAEPCEF